ncbi:MAG: hypothetical protein AB1700_10080 [Bacillota bacterium]
MIVGKFLYDVLVGAPTTIMLQILEGLRDEVDKGRLATEESIKERLQQLQLLLESGELAEDEYEDLEEKLIERLKLVRETEKGT